MTQIPKRYGFDRLTNDETTYCSCWGLASAISEMAKWRQDEETIVNIYARFVQLMLKDANVVFGEYSGNTSSKENENFCRILGENVSLALTLIAE